MQRCVPLRKRCPHVVDNQPIEGLGGSTMTITFDRSVCCDLNETISREWLVTNGLGGYAAGTIAGVLTRRHHGLFVAQPPDATSPQLLLAKIDEEVVFDERTYNLGTNEYRDGTLNPSGCTRVAIRLTFNIAFCVPPALIVQAIEEVV